jgi:hypothetical protein
MNVPIHIVESTHIGVLKSVVGTVPGWILAGDTSDCGWDAIHDEHPPVTVILAQNEGTTLSFAGLSLEDDFPDFRRRRDIYRRCTRAGGRHILVLVDAAEIRRIWLWERRRSGQQADYRESLEPESVEDLTRLLKAATDDLAGMEDSRDSPERAIHAHLERALRTTERGDAGEPRGASGHHLLEAIAGAPDPADTRKLWRSLRQIRLVDLSCGEGNWLLGGAATMESFYAACLAKMAGWVLDSEHVSRGGSGRHRGFRLLLTQAGNRAEQSFDRHILRRTILYNLHGIARLPLDAEVTRLRLSRAVAAVDPNFDRSSPLPEWTYGS